MKEETKCYCGHTSYCDCEPEEIKQTAVEWLESKFNEFETIYYSLPSGLYEYVNQAKEMEKKQQGYSEEDALNLLTHFAVEIQRQNKKGQYPIEIKGWFERNKETFKNK